MNGPRGRGPSCTFSVLQEAGRWQVLRDAVPLAGRFHSSGDAVRVACSRARGEERRGGRARVVGPDDDLMPHYEAHFGL